MTSPLDALSGPGKPLVAEPPDATEIAGLVRSGRARLADAGIASLSLESRFVGIPQADLRAELDRFVDLLATGLAAVAAR